MPGFMAYMSSIKQEAAAAASAAIMCLNFVLSGALISAAVVGLRTLGAGGLFAILGGINFGAVVLAACVVVAHFRSPRGAGQASGAGAEQGPTAEAVKNSDAAMITTEGIQL